MSLHWQKPRQLDFAAELGRRAAAGTKSHPNVRYTTGSGDSLRCELSGGY